jgi:hypothetical protein
MNIDNSFALIQKMLRAFFIDIARIGQTPMSKIRRNPTYRENT